MAETAAAMQEAPAEMTEAIRTLNQALDATHGSGEGARKPRYRAEPVATTEAAHPAA